MIKEYLIYLIISFKKNLFAFIYLKLEKKKIPLKENFIDINFSQFNSINYKKKIKILYFHAIKKIF